MSIADMLVATLRASLLGSAFKMFGVVSGMFQGSPQRLGELPSSLMLSESPMESAAQNDLITHDVASAGLARRSPTESEPREACDLLIAQSLVRRFATIIIGCVLLLASLIMGNLYTSASGTDASLVGVQAETKPRPLTADLEASLVWLIGETLIHHDCTFPSSTLIAAQGLPQAERSTGVNPSVAVAAKRTPQCKDEQ
jgi:hypothetical protein